MKMKVDQSFIFLVSLALLGAPLPSVAQNNNGGGNRGGGGGGTTDGGNQQPAQTTAPSPANTGKTDAGNNSSSRGNGNKTTTPPASKTTDDSKATSSAAITGGEAANTDAPPALSTPSSSSIGAPTTTFGGQAAGPDDALPSIVGIIPNYVAQVPQTAKNPFMQKSNLPEGTVFIAVGSALGLIGLICIAWRALVAWSLRRSLRRSAMESHFSDSKTMLGPSGGNSAGHTAGAAPRKKPRNSGLYTSQYGSSLSLDHLANGPGGSANRGNNTPNPSLFFSPTAGSGAMTPGQRGSGYLPAGYYSAAGGNSSQTNLPRRPNTAGTMQTMTAPSPPSSPLPKPPSRGRLPTPQDSPRLGTSHSAHSLMAGLAAPPGQQRTPSTYLEDLFEQHPPPTASSQGNRDSYRDSYNQGGSGRSRHSQYGRNY